MIRKFKKVLIFGTLPPPVGGVTKSVESLYNALQKKGIETDIVCSKNLKNRYDIAHVHFSKSWKRFVALLLGKIVAKKVIFTLHGNVYTSDLFNWLSSKLADGAILLNEDAQKKYKHLFKSSIVLPSFFPEGIANLENEENFFDTEKYKEDVKVLFYAFDKIPFEGKDLYGMDFVLNNIKNFPKKYLLIFVDPRGAYNKDIEKIKNNLLYIDKEVDFLSLLKQVDIYVRPTRTDGDSVAIQEALMLGKPVLASDVVPRQPGVTLYRIGDWEDFVKKLKYISQQKNDFEKNTIITKRSIEKYITYCQKLLREKGTNIC